MIKQDKIAHKYQDLMQHLMGKGLLLVSIELDYRKLKMLSSILNLVDILKQLPNKILNKIKQNLK